MSEHSCINLMGYNRMKTPPVDAIKEITGGNLAGMSNVNPQWRIEIMTEVYGPCGIGWKYEICDTVTVPCGDGQILLYMKVALYTKLTDGKNGWSEPIFAWGGDMIIEKNKNGLVPNDEAYKMSMTDALGNAMRYLGVAADAYRGKFDNKYGRAQNVANSPAKRTETPSANNSSPTATGSSGEPFTKHEKGQLWVKSLKDGSWLCVNDMKIGQMKWAANCAKYADAKAEIAMLGAEKFGAEWNQ